MLSIFSKKHAEPAQRKSPLLQELSRASRGLPLYLVMVQDFMSLSNYGGFFRGLKIFDDPEEGLKYLYSQGQREAGLVVEIAATNNRQFSSMAEPAHRFPETYEAFRDDWIVCRHEPTQFVVERFGICGIVGAGEREGLSLAVRRMVEEEVFTVAARIYEIADAEHGSYYGIRKVKGRASVKGVQ